MQIPAVQLVEEEGFSIELYNDPFNKRIRIDDYRGDVKKIILKVEEYATTSLTEKIIFKVRHEHLAIFLEKGYVLEGRICHYFRGSDAWFFCKYLSIERKKSDHWLTEDKIISNIQIMEVINEGIHLPPQYQLRKLDETDAVGLAYLYQTVFQIYPTPLNDPNYIKKTMEEGTIYFGYVINDKVVSAASAEVNDFYKNAELTDCATIKEHRKFGLMKQLLRHLEMELMKNGVYCVYSLARALSFGMNAVLHQLGFHYQGRLANNCYIYDKVEDMNVWVKNH